MATASKQLQVLQVAVQWGISSENMKSMLPASQPLNPTLRERHLVVSSWLPGGTSDSQLDASMTQISHIELLPTGVDTVNKAYFPPLIFTVRSFVPTPDTSYNQEMQSIVDRWEIRMDDPQSLHSAFENLGSRRNSVGSAPPVRTDPIISQWHRLTNPFSRLLQD
jgi:mediator of RNA polymerase II transcription subunit 16